MTAILARAALLAVVGTLALTAGPASAGFVTAEPYLHGRVDFFDVAAEANDVLFEFQPGPGGSQEAVITDRGGQPIICERGLHAIDSPCSDTTWEFNGCRSGGRPNVVVCRFDPAAVSFFINLADGDDRAEVEGSYPFLMYGGNGNDRLAGAAGPDTLLGGAGNDVLRGGDGDDVLRGDVDDDQLEGGAGADDLSGGAGNDSLTYASRGQRVEVFLDDDFPNDGTPRSERDNARSDIEILTGGSADDLLIGGRRRNELHGGRGDDYLEGGPGTTQDILDGGAGVDMAFYGSRTEPIVVDLRRPFGDGQPGEDDDLREIERVTGGAGDDQLTGSDGRDVLDGGRGDDRISGAGGADDLYGAVGRDALYGFESPRAFDRISCGADTDNAVADPGDIVNATDCENPDVFAAPASVLNAGGVAVYASAAKATVELACAAAISCIGDVVLSKSAAPGAKSSARRRPVPITLMRGRYSLRSGQRRVFTFRLTRAGRSVFRRRPARGAARRGAVSASLLIRARDGAGHVSSERRAVRVRLGRRPRVVRPPLFEPLPRPVTQPAPEARGTPEPGPPAPRGCDDDAAEENDDFLKPTELASFSPFQGRICPGDPDYFALPFIEDGKTVAVVATPDSGADVRLDLYTGNSEGKLVATSSSVGRGGAESVSHKNQSGDTLRLYVRVTGSEGAYALDPTSG